MNPIICRYATLIDAFKDSQMVIDIYNDAKNNVRYSYIILFTNNHHYLIQTILLFLAFNSIQFNSIQIPLPNNTSYLLRTLMLLYSSLRNP